MLHASTVLEKRDENRIFQSVVGTPDRLHFKSHSWFDGYWPQRNQPDALRYDSTPSCT